jgi:hypothetical protein
MILRPNPACKAGLAGRAPVKIHNCDLEVFQALFVRKISSSRPLRVFYLLDSAFLLE